MFDPNSALPNGFGPIAPPNPSGDFYGAFEALGDFTETITDGLVSIAELVVSAWKGANTILDYILDFIPSFDVFVDLLPSVPSAVAMSVLSVMVTVVTFKVVGYFT